MRAPLARSALLPPLTVLLLGLLAGCAVDGGAVSVRWRIVDRATGVNYDPRDLSSKSACCLITDASGGCPSDNVWVVHQLGIALRDPASGASVATGEGRFGCRAGERTTGFDLPPGSYAIGLEVFDAAGEIAGAAVPPPEVRSIVRGQIVNLQVIEVGVDALPLPEAASMATL